MDLDCFRSEIGQRGYVLFAEVVHPALLDRLRRDIPHHFRRCEALQRRNGVSGGMAGVAHHVLGERDSLDDFIAGLPLDVYLRDYFGGEYILNSFGAVDNLPNSMTRYEHGHRFHRDVRTYSSGFRLMINMLVMVDEFTEHNGATRLVPGSHLSAERPLEEYLEQHSTSAVGKAGSVVLFDSNLWHSAAPNLGTESRRALTLTFTRPFMKQQLDYPRMLGEEFTQEPQLRQILGYNARVPLNHDEWYQPPEKRMYRPGQG